MIPQSPANEAYEDLLEYLKSVHDYKLVRAVHETPPTALSALRKEQLQNISREYSDNRAKLEILGRAAEALES